MVSSLYSKKAGRLCLLVALLFLFQMGISIAAEKDEKLSGIYYKDGLLKVSVERQKFKDIMDEIAEKAEIKIIFDYPGEEEITTSFNYLPLEKGLRLLLKDKNYAFKYQTEEDNALKNSTSLMKVFVISKSGEVTVAKSEGLDNNGYPDNARQTIATNELQDQIRGNLDEVLALYSYPQSGVDVAKQFREAMDEIKEREGIFEEKTEFEGSADIEEQIKEALQVLQGKGNIIAQ